MTYELTTLPSGLRVASEVLPGVETVSVCVTVDVGARFEEPSEGGLSHVLEHMAFKGTTRRSAYQIAEAIDEVGGVINAYTSLENTVYYVKVMQRDTALAVDILADILQNSVFDEHELSRELQVILQEIAMYQDSPEDVLSEEFYGVAYPTQPLGRPIIGAAERVGSFTRADVAHFMRKHYCASRMVVSAAGCVNHAELVKLVRDAFALPTGATLTPARAVYEGGNVRTVKPHLEQWHVMLGLPAPHVHEALYYPAMILSTVLGGGMSSRLFQEVREKRGLAYSVSCFLSSYVDTGLLSLYAGTSPEKAAELVPTLCEELYAITRGVSAGELLRGKNQHIAGLLMARESTSSVAEWIGKHLLTYGEYRPARVLTPLIEAVTAEEVMTAAAHALEGTPTLATLGPEAAWEPYDATCKRLAA